MYYKIYILYYLSSKSIERLLILCWSFPGDKWSILNSHLDPGFWQVDLEGDLFAHEDVGVASLGEERFENVQLRAGERRPFPSLLPWVA